jgi:hypothetical protein
MAGKGYKPWKNYHEQHINADGTTKQQLFDPKSGEFETGEHAKVIETKNGRLAIEAEHPNKEYDHHLFKFLGKKK